MRAVIVVALAACRIAPIDYTGKECPCPDGWQCNLATYTCTEAASGDGGGSNQDGSTNPDGSNPADSCLANPRTTLLYATVGFPDFPQAWLQASGQWTKNGPEVQSTNSANPLAWLSHPVQTSSGLANYRVVATMRYIESLSGGSVGIGFRIGQQGTMYTCTFDPVAGEFDLIYTQQGIDSPLERKLINVNGSSTGAFTMEIMTSGNTQTCCLRGYDASTLSMPAGFIMTGSPGVVSRDAQGAFASFYVYE